jgi:hypothetical protein
VPRGGLPLPNTINELEIGGTPNCSTGSLGFLPQVSHWDATGGNVDREDVTTSGSGSAWPVSSPPPATISSDPHDRGRERCGDQTEILVPAELRTAQWLAPKKQTNSRPVQPLVGEPPSLTVAGLPARTAVKHGISGPEIERISGAVQFMEKSCPNQGRLWWVTLNRGSTREIIADVQKRITKMQKRQNLPPYNATVFETLGGLHAHIVFIGNRKIVRCLEGSAKFSGLIDLDRVNDPQGLTRNYLAKERTPQAGYRREHILGGRIKGSHHLLGGGDRVRLSRELERDAVEAGYVAVWQHSNARRSLGRKPYRRRLTATAPPSALQIGGE